MYSRRTTPIVYVRFCKIRVETQSYCTHPYKNPVIVVKMCPIEIIIEPAMLAISAVCFLDCRDKKAAQEPHQVEDQLAEGDSDAF